MSASLEIGLLGPLVVRRDGDEIEVAAPKQRALLALLALDAGRAVSTDELVDKLWAGQSPESAGTALQVYVSQLRKHLGADAIATRRPGYALELSPQNVDAARFERLVADGRSLLASEEPESAVAALTEALSMWRGSCLAEFAYEEWAGAAIRRLEELRLVAIEDRLDAQLQLGHGAQLTGDLEGLVREHPFRERLRGQQMLALYRAGRQADALSAYQEARAALVDGLGIDPGPELVELERRILQQDPALRPTPPGLPEVSARQPAPAPLAAAGAVPRAARLCPGCAAEVPGAAKFCAECGALLAPPPSADQRRRKLVTVLFCDVVGSTALAERLDAEVVREVMGRYFDAASAVISRHGGSVEKFIGDAVVALFGVPTIHEDDAMRAVRAAAEIRTAVAVLAESTLSRWGVGLETRIGVNTGEVVVGADRFGASLATGETVNVTARLEQSAGAGQILLGEDTWQLVRDAVIAEPIGSLQVRGRTEAVRPHRLLEVLPDTPGHRRRLDVPFVGREAERKLLRDSYDRWVSERACGLVTLLGNAGVGKSRLVAETLGDLSGEPQVIRGRCLAYGSGITYWPVAEAVRQLVGADDDHTPEQVQERVRRRLDGVPDRDQVEAGILALLGAADADAGAEDAQRAVCRLVEREARDRPLVLLIDDLQWAEPALLDLVEELVDSIADAPVLVLCIARPELLDLRSGWGGGKLNAVTILLEPLAASQTDELVRHLLGDRSAPESLLERVATAAAGNPLFAEELLAYLQERGYVTISGDKVEVAEGLAQVDLPPTIRALISSRLDQLPEDERNVLDRGSIEGEVFHAGAVEALADGQSCAAALRRLVRKQVLKHEPAQLAGQEGFRFRHLLIRDATYEGIPKRQRAQWHRGFAEWLERTAGARMSEYAEILAHHYAASFGYHAELGTPDEELRDRAAALLRSTSDRAISQNDLTTGATLLAQLVTVFDPGSQERVLALADCASLQVHAARIEEAKRTLAEAEQGLDGHSRATSIHVQAAGAVVRCHLRMPMVVSNEELRSLAEEATAAGWHRTAAMAWWAVAYTSELCAEVKLQAAQRCREQGQLAGIRWLEQQGDFQEGLYCLEGSAPISWAIERCDALFPPTATRQLTLLLRSVYLGWLTAMQGNIDTAHDHFSDARGRPVEVLETWGDSREGRALVCLGLEEQALPYLLAAMEAREGLGRGDDPDLTASLARVYVRMGERDTAAAYLRRAEAAIGSPGAESGDLDVTTQAFVCGTRAVLQQQERKHAQAIAEAKRAVTLLERTDFADGLGLALIDLASICAETGGAAEAHAAAERAVALLDRRGAFGLRDRAQKILDEAAGLLTR